MNYTEHPFLLAHYTFELGGTIKIPQQQLSTEPRALLQPTRQGLVKGITHIRQGLNIAPLVGRTYSAIVL